jgi:tetratricopeptide (TPR) repeat protein
MRPAIPRIFILIFLVVDFPRADDAAAEWLVRARHAFETGDLADAGEAAEKARAANPQLADAYVLLGLVATRQNKIADAEQLFRKAALLEPANYRTLSYVGSACLQQGRAAEAAEVFARVLRMQPSDPVAHYNLGLIELSKGKAALAKKHFDAVRAANPSDVPACIGALESDLMLKDHQTARRVANEIDGLLAAESPDRLRVAALLGSYDEYAAAVPILEKIPLNAAHAEEVSFDLALAQFHLGEFDQAAAVITRVPSSSKNAEAVNLLGEIEEARNHPEEALAAFRKAAEAEPKNENFWFSYGLFLLKRERGAEAASVFSTGLAGVPGSGRLRLGLAVAWYSSGMYEQAAECLLKLTTEQGGAGMAYYLLGEMYEAVPEAQDRIAAALATYLNSQPPDALAYREYGKILFLRAMSSKAPDYRAAKESLRKALTLNPKLAEVYLQLAIVAQSEGNVAESVPLLEKALALKPELGNAHYRLALAYRKLGWNGKAETEMDIYSRQKRDETDAPRQEMIRSLAISAPAKKTN